MKNILRPGSFQSITRGNLFNYSSMFRSPAFAQANLHAANFRRMCTLNLKNNPEIVKTLMDNDASKVRNIGIIAHVDHGKTTLVDCMLKESGINFESERAMDNIDIEQERGITIMSKCTSVIYKGHKINVVDTPGHADFGGEVERIMSMVDGVCLVVCASEGPMAQTKFVLDKALKQNAIPIVVINKVDREMARVVDVENEVFDLFCALEPTDEQLEYPMIYASAKDGWASLDPDEKTNSVSALLDQIIETVPQPKVDTDSTDFKMLVTQTESNKYFGRLLVGKIQRGSIKVGDKIQAVDSEGKIVQVSSILKIFKKFGVGEAQIDEAFQGDIVSIAGVGGATVGCTINCEGNSEVIKSIPIDPPMISVCVTFNDSPFQGQEAEKNTINQIIARLNEEADNDVSLRVTQDSTNKEIFEVSGRGDLHIGVLLEKMRREGFEIAAYPPKVLMKETPEGLMEPIEKVEIECDPDHMSRIIDNLNNRKGILLDSHSTPDGRDVLEFQVPSRGLIGFRSQLIGDTRGTAVMKSEFLEYDYHRGDVKKSNKGAIISTAEGTTTPYALKDVETKGRLFVGPGERVYPGMVIGEHTLESDIEMNPVKTKKSTNIRSAGTDEQIKLIPKIDLSLEEAIAQARDDELVEVTPKSIRVRKVVLDMNERRRMKRKEKNNKR
ncbi:unnamed protein product [Moneuplotes crassus]|uniref:Tr-type G domain-containing protein n=1 Tax=Euplotes crassus TaxID=5936 RepID=A0AAD1Y993_EUPCR|nr:unnamed protein product [Moneuplotes crassus]